MTLPDETASIREFGRQMVHDEARALDALAAQTTENARRLFRVN